MKKLIIIALLLLIPLALAITPQPPIDACSVGGDNLGNHRNIK